MRLRRLSLLTGLLLLLGGGGYVLVGIVWPAWYAKALLKVEAELRTSPLPPAGQAGDITLDGALAQIQAQRDFLSGIQGKIRALRPAPPRFRELQGDLEGVSAWLASRSGESERGVRFLAGSRELAALVRRGFPSGVQSITVGQFLTRYGPELDRIRERGDALFGGEFPTHPEVTELAAAWREETRAALDAILVDLRAQDPSLPIQTAADRLGATRAPEVNALDRFQERLEGVASTSLGSALIPPSDTGSAPPDVQARLARISQALNQIKQQYPQYVSDGSR